MTEVFSTDDVLVFNPNNEDNREIDFSVNIGPIGDEYRPLKKYTFSSKGWIGDSSLIMVENLRTGNITSGFWWRLKKKNVLFKYDPKQAGDQDDDI